MEYKGIKFTATAAGHVLGAAMFSIEIDGIRVLYTGDYSMEEDRHLAQAEIPPGGPPDVLIIESTFGTMNVDTRYVCRRTLGAAARLTAAPPPTENDAKRSSRRPSSRSFCAAARA